MSAQRIHTITRSTGTRSMLILFEVPHRMRCIDYLYALIVILLTRPSICYYSGGQAFRIKKSYTPFVPPFSIFLVKPKGVSLMDSRSNVIESPSRTVVGSWEEIHGNYVLRPNTKSNQSPRALIHFIGGAIVGAAPDLSYRYMLEKLSEYGFLIVATPYQLSFDYISTCDGIISRFEKIAPDLARTFGALPVIGVGHSCGALLQILITSLFPDTPRAANALIAFNNKPAKDAVPLFEELVAPFFVAVSSENSTLPNAVDVIHSSLQILRAFAKGTVPSDDVLTDFIREFVPSEYAQSASIAVPDPLRSAIEQLLLPISKTKRDIGLLPMIDQTIDVLEQIPSLMQEVADGARDFDPPASAVKVAVRRAYRARRTLIINYEGDSFDESDDVEQLLRESETLMRMKKPMLPFDIQRVTLQGIHATPCIAPPMDIATKAEDILGSDVSRQRLLYSGADDTVEAILKWLEEGQL